MGLIAICIPFLLNAPPFTFFGNSFSVTLRNFTTFSTYLFSFRKVTNPYGSCIYSFFSFRRSYGNSRIARQHLLLVSAPLRNFADRVNLLPFDFRRVSGLTYRATKGAKYLEAANQRLHIIK